MGKKRISQKNFYQIKTYKVVISGILIALGVIFGSIFYIPILGGKMFPIQHFINVVSAIILGPFYAVLNAFCVSLIRNILGTGSLLAFQGSMIGALVAGIIYKRSKKIYMTALGEVIGTGIIGALVAYPIAKMVMGKEVALFAFIFPFSLSCIGGAAFAILFLNIPQIKELIKNMEVS